MPSQPSGSGLSFIINWIPNHYWSIKILCVLKLMMSNNPLVFMVRQMCQVEPRRPNPVFGGVFLAKWTFCNCSDFILSLSNFNLVSFPWLSKKRLSQSGTTFQSGIHSPKVPSSAPVTETLDCYNVITRSGHRLSLKPNRQARIESKVKETSATGTGISLLKTIGRYILHGSNLSKQQKRNLWRECKWYCDLESGMNLTNKHRPKLE